MGYQADDLIVGFSGEATMNWHALFLSIQVTAFASAGAFVVGLALALFLVRTRLRGKNVVETLILLPLVLPPTVLGYYLLLILGRSGPLVRWFDLNILFTWPAAAIAAGIVGLPLMVQASRAALESVDPTLEQSARILGSTEWEILWRVTFPLARPGITAGWVLATARALGEFGATLMVAGNIPGRTQTMPLAIYDAVQANRLDEANAMVMLLTLLSFVGLWFVNRGQGWLGARRAIR